MRLLALDQATTMTGYSVFVGKDLLRWGVIDLRKFKCATPTERFEEMCRRIRDIIVKNRLDAVVFEDINQQQCIRTTILLGRLEGAVIMSCINKGLPYSMYQSTAWRKILGFEQGTIKRAALKKQAIDFVNKNYSIHVGDDASEAICLGVAHLINLGQICTADDIAAKKDSKEAPAVDQTGIKRNEKK